MEPSSSPQTLSFNQPMEIKIQNETYTILFDCDSQKDYKIRVEKKLSKYGYEKKFRLQELEKEHENWPAMTKNKAQFEDLIFANIIEGTVESFLKEKSLLLMFVLKTTINNKNYKTDYPMTLERKEYEMADVLEQHGTHIQKIEESMDHVLKEMAAKIQKLESELNDLKKGEVEYLNTPFLPPQNNEPSMVLSDDNRTVTRTVGNWFGVKCNIVNKPAGKFVFSVRVDSYSSVFMLGYCIANAVNINSGTGYYATNQSYMFYITSNTFYNKGTTNAYSCFVEAPKVGDIFSVFADTRQKVMVLYYNGRQLSIPKPMNINENEKIQLAPCVDLSSTNTSLTLVDFKDIAF